MKIKENISLSGYTSLRIGGTAKFFYEIESEEDVKEVYATTGSNVRVIAGGSNLLINDKAKFEHIIYMNSLYQALSIDKNGIITASSSVPIQKFLKFVSQQGYSGAEYLNSLPARIGGIVAMNAGRGKRYNQMISDYIMDVTIFDGKEYRTILRDACSFGYRTSIFQKEKWIILSARFKFNELLSIEEGNKRLKERAHFAKEHQDIEFYNAGSVFKVANYRILKFISWTGLGYAKGCRFSKRVPNWINNEGSGTYKQAMFLINFIKLLHKIVGKKCELEWVVWDK